MRLDDLARTATETLLAETTPDTGARLADLKQIRRNRSVTRTVAAGVALVAVIGGWAALREGDDGRPEPAEPAYQNGALLIAGNNIRVLDGGDESLLLPDDYRGDGDIAFAADGSELLYINGYQRIDAFDVETGETRVVVPCSSWVTCSTALSPDGRWLAQPDDGGIRLRELDGDAHEVLPTPGVTVYGLAWSPDGETLALSSLDGIYTMPIAGSDPRPLVEFDGSRRIAGRVQWSPDGRTIAFVEARRSAKPEYGGIPREQLLLRLIETDGGDLRTLTDLGECICVRGPGPDFAWAPDGSVIAASRVKVPSGRPIPPAPDGVYLVSHDGHAERIARGPVGTLAWQPIPEG
jgi:WD40 repeat protein